MLHSQILNSCSSETSVVYHTSSHPNWRNLHTRRPKILRPHTVTFCMEDEPWPQTLRNHQVLFGRCNQEWWDGRVMWHVGSRRKIHIEFWWGNTEERDYFKYIGVAGKIILKLILREKDERVWNGLIWLRRGTSDVLLWTRLWTSGFHKIQGICGLAEDLRAYQKGPCFM